MENIINFIVNNGVAVGVVLYFLWKDSMLTKENTEILQQVKTLLEHICEHGNILLKGKDKKNEN